MQRRTFLLSTLVATSLSGMAWAEAPAMVDFDESDPISAALAEGKTVFVDYAADWCSTCKAQERVIQALRSENPDYDANITFIRVDWDDFGGASVTTDRNIPRRSTLIVLKGDEELGRIVAGTSKDEIELLMDVALDAAASS